MRPTPLASSTRGASLPYPAARRIPGEATSGGTTMHETGPDVWAMLMVFLLAGFVGFQVIQNVSRLLHTPLMSLTNAISAIAIVASIIIAGEQKTLSSTILGTIAVAASMTNIVSGFLITDRMLKMFKDKGPRK
jgi:NAD(P) transhydrogenase subunit alpha